MAGWQLQQLLDGKGLVTVSHTLITSRFEFGNGLYVGCSHSLHGLHLKIVWKLPRVQNVAAWMPKGTRRSEHMNPVLQDCLFYVARLWFAELGVGKL